MKKRIWGGLAMLGALALAPACNGINTDGNRQNTELKPVTAPDAGPAATDGPRQIEVARPPFQAKSSAQLFRSIEACVGGAAIWVTTDMVVTPTNTAGFLTNDFADGDDIVDVQKLLFDGTPDALRTGTRVDQITLEYITALKNVANVVGYRCENALTQDNALCSCESEADSKAMLARCLAAVADPTTPEFAQLATDFHTACANSRGTAIASMIASLAFAKLP